MAKVGRALLKRRKKSLSALADEVQNSRFTMRQNSSGSPSLLAGLEL